MMGSILRFHHIRIHEAFIAIAGAMLALSVYHFALHIIPQRIQQIIISVSRSINTIYCCQWVIIAWLASLWVISGQKAFSDGVVILIGLAIFLICAVLAGLIAKWKQSRTVSAK